MKKKQRCFVKRFAALVAALMLCASLSLPAFASNNAQWCKWVITDSKQLTNESGTMSTYFQLTPFVDGNVYAATISSHASAVKFSSASSPGSWESFVLYCDNYPDWWRSAVPLGARSYVQADVKSFSWSSSYSGYRTPVSSGNLYVFDRNNALVVGSISIGSGTTSNGYISTVGAPSAFFISGQSATTSATVSPVAFSVGDSLVFSPNDLFNIVPGFPLSSSANFDNVRYSTIPLSNLSSDTIVFGVFSGNLTSGRYYHATVEITYWADANKLPPGLQVGDEFPADTEAFDQLRDELLNQFPEASENIQNGKDTLTGWNDTETVDTDVASTSISVLNAMFQNLGGFLFIISLMVFGAVVLRMFIKKAVDG